MSTIWHGSSVGIVWTSTISCSTSSSGQLGAARTTSFRMLANGRPDVWSCCATAAAGGRQRRQERRRAEAQKRDLWAEALGEALRAARLLADLEEHGRDRLRQALVLGRNIRGCVLPVGGWKRRRGGSGSQHCILRSAEVWKGEGGGDRLWIWQSYSPHDGSGQNMPSESRRTPANVDSPAAQRASTRAWRGLRPSSRGGGGGGNASDDGLGDGNASMSLCSGRCVISCVVNGRNASRSMCLRSTSGCRSSTRLRYS